MLRNEDESTHILQKALKFLDQFDLLTPENSNKVSSLDPEALKFLSTFRITKNKISPEYYAIPQALFRNIDKLASQVIPQNDATVTQNKWPHLQNETKTQAKKNRSEIERAVDYGYLFIQKACPISIRDYNNPEIINLKKNTPDLVHEVMHELSFENGNVYREICSALGWLIVRNLASKENITQVKQHRLGVYLLELFNYAFEDCTFEEERKFCAFLFENALPFIQAKHAACAELIFPLPHAEQLQIADKLITQIQTLSKISEVHPEQKHFNSQIIEVLTQLNSYYFHDAYRSDQLEDLRNPNAAECYYQEKKKQALKRGEQFFEVPPIHHDQPSEAKFDFTGLQNEAELEQLNATTKALLKAGTEYSGLSIKLETITATKLLIELDYFNANYLQKIISMQPEMLEQVNDGLALMQHHLKNTNVKLAWTTFSELLFTYPEKASAYIQAMRWLLDADYLTADNVKQLEKFPAEHFYKLDYINLGITLDKTYLNQIRKNIFDNFIHYPKQEHYEPNNDSDPIPPSQEILQKDQSDFITDTLSKREGRRKCDPMLCNYIALKLNSDNMKKFTSGFEVLKAKSGFSVFGVSKRPSQLDASPITRNEIDALFNLMHLPYQLFYPAVEAITWLGILRLATKENLSFITQNPYSAFILSEMAFDFEGKHGAYKRSRIKPKLQAFEDQMHAKLQQPDVAMAQTLAKLIFESVKPIMLSAEAKLAATTIIDEKENISREERRERLNRLPERHFVNFTSNKNALYTHTITAIPTGNHSNPLYTFAICEMESKKEIFKFTEALAFDDINFIFVTPAIAIIEFKQINSNTIKFYDAASNHCFHTLSHWTPFKLLDEERFVYRGDENLINFNFITREKQTVSLQNKNLYIEKIIGEYKNRLAIKSHQELIILANNTEEKDITLSARLENILKIDDHNWYCCEVKHRRICTGTFESTYAFADVALTHFSLNETTMEFKKEKVYNIKHSPQNALLTKENIYIYQDLDQLYGLDLNEDKPEPKSLFTHPSGFYDHPRMKFDIVNNNTLYIQLANSAFQEPRLLSYDVSRLREFLREAKLPDDASQLKSQANPTTCFPPDKDNNPLAIWLRQQKQSITTNVTLSTHQSNFWNNNQEQKQEAMIENKSEFQFK